jgi:hypothetical protein
VLITLLNDSNNTRKQGEKDLVQVQSLIPRDVEVQRLKKLYIQIILMLSLTIVAVIPTVWIPH